MKLMCFCLLNLLIVLVGCKSEKDEITKYLNNLERNLPEQDIIDFAETLEFEINIIPVSNNYDLNYYISPINYHIDFRAFFYRGFQSINGFDKKFEMFKHLESAILSLEYDFYYFNNLRKKYNYINFIGHYSDSSDFNVIVFQCFDRNNELAIIEFTVSKKDSRVLIIDIRDIEYGEYFSEHIVLNASEFLGIGYITEVNLLELVQEINYYKEEGRYQDALFTFETIPEKYRTEYELFDEIELEILKYSNVDLYIKKLKIIQSENKYEPSKLFQKMLISLCKNDFKEAIICIDALINIYPNSSALHNKKAICFEKLELPDEAIKNYLKAVELSPNIWEIKGNLFKLYLKEEKNKEGMEVLAEIVKAGTVVLNYFEQYLKDNYTSLYQSQEFSDIKSSLELNDTISYKYESETYKNESVILITEPIR